MSMVKNSTALFAALTLVTCSPRTSPSEAEDTVRTRLARFEQDCGFAVTIPSSANSVRQMFAEKHADIYEVEAPPSMGFSGDGVFPITTSFEFDHGAVVGAVVVICELDKGFMRFSRSPRFAFYFDETGTVFHVEEHSLLSGL